MMRGKEEREGPRGERQCLPIADKGTRPGKDVEVSTEMGGQLAGLGFPTTICGTLGAGGRTRVHVQPERKVRKWMH